MTTIYNYNPKTCEFTNEAIADESPLEPGVILLPANATTIAPPTTAAREVSVFADGQWSAKPDWRGVALYSTTDGSTVSISEIGQVPDSTMTEAPRPSAVHAWKVTRGVGAWVVDASLQAAEEAKQAAALIATYARAIDQHLDSVAKAKGYDSRINFALRAGYAGPYHDEGVAFATWMDTCNAQAYATLAAVKAGTQAMPTVEDFIANLPPAPTFAS